ncbi:hypothetical protein AC35_0412 [Escherichia coli 3-475-03_S3_C2]|nr:hypothetical protein AC35_0412 [Escherichia coli 3-475-03_S3_C2]
MKLALTLEADSLFPSFIIYYNIYFNKNRYYQSHLSQCNLISVFIF